MRQLNKWQSMTYVIGGLLMVLGAGCFAFLIGWKYTCWVYLAGAVMFSMMQSMQWYEGKSLTIRRLKRIQAVAELFFVLAGISMTDTAYGFFSGFFSRIVYLDYIYNKWVILLLIAALLELYTMHRIGSELKKES